jgi:Tfp pilus assembly protein PilX
MYSIRHKEGVILIFVLLVLVALMGVALSFWYMVNSEIRTAGAGLMNAQAFYIAEAGRAQARYDLTTGGQAMPYPTKTNVSFANGTYTVSVAYSDPPTNQHVTITSDGYIPNNTNIRAHRQIKENSISLGSGSNLSLATNGTVASSSGHQGKDNTEDKAIDGTNSTGWVAKDKGGSATLTLRYTSAKTVSRVVVNGSNIASVVVQYSSNGTSWTNVSSPSGALPGTQTFTPVTAQYLRLSMTSSSGSRAQVNEFESYSGTGVGTTLDKGKFGTSL